MRDNEKCKVDIVRIITCYILSYVQRIKVTIYVLQ